MGVALDSPEERAALLATPVHQEFPTKQFQEAQQPPSPPQNWDGHLCACCGPQCSASGWGSCAFSYFLPCFAFGSNMKRAFRSSLLVQALLFFVLFYGVHYALNVASIYTSDSCTSSPPTPVRPPHTQQAVDANAHATWLSGRKLLQIDDGPGKFTEAFADVLPSAAVAHAVVHGGSEDAPSGSEAVDQSSDTLNDHLPLEGGAAERVPHRPSMYRTCFKLSLFEVCTGPHADSRPDQRHPITMPFSPEFQKVSPGCQKAFLGIAALYHLAIFSFVFGIVYAARLRTLMRQKFLIPGSAWRDFGAWLCCPLCALCQETRTLRLNSVRDGQWGNFPQPGLVVTAADWAEPTLVKPPKAADMQEV